MNESQAVLAAVVLSKEPYFELSGRLFSSLSLTYVRWGCARIVKSFKSFTFYSTFCLPRQLSHGAAVPGKAVDGSCFYLEF